MFERYTDAAKRAIYFARLEAVHRGVSAIEPADVLVGLTWEVNTRADRIARLKDNALVLRARVGIPHRPITATSYRDNRDFPLSMESKRIIAFAAQEANADRQFYIDTDHLLRGLLRTSGAASHSLKESGVSLKSMRAASREDRVRNPVEEVPWYWKPPILYSRKDLKLIIVLTAIILLFAGGILHALWSVGFWHD